MTRNWEKELRTHKLKESMIRHINKISSESWEFLPWKKFQTNLFRLQRRVWKAVRAGDKQKARSLQKLILRSQAARFLRRLLSGKLPTQNAPWLFVKLHS